MIAKKKDTLLSVLLESRDFLKVLCEKLSTVTEKPFVSKSNDRFTTLKDGWVKDKLLGLDWGPSSEKTMNWVDAQKYCIEKGGRLPAVEELSRLVDYKKSSPAIDKDFFPDTKTNDWYWTGTPVAWNTGFAWVVHFDYGGVSYYGKGSSGYVRPVRSSQ